MKFRLSTTRMFYNYEFKHAQEEIKELEKLGFEFEEDSYVRDTYHISGTPDIDIESVGDICRLLNYWKHDGYVLSFYPKPAIEIYNDYRE